MASVTLIFGDKEVADYPFDKPALVVGRDESSDIHIDNLGISRAHCQFIKRGVTFLLQDMNSANGTFVNGRKIGEHYLNDKDEIVLGKYSLVFHNDEQQADAKDDRHDLVPDSLNTYVMDGASIREKLAQMQAEGGAAAPAPAAAPGSDGAPLSAAALAAQMGGAAPAAPAAPAASPVAPRVITRAAPARSNAPLVMSIAVNVVLLAILLYLLFSGKIVLEGLQMEEIPPAPIDEPAAEAPADPG